MQNAAQRAVQNTTGPLDGHQFSRLTQAIQGLTADQLSWASGYLAGVAALPAQAPEATDTPWLTILYASQGGNARSVAEALASDATERGLAPRLVSAEQYRPRDLSKEKLLIVVICTQGEGEPPESARELFRHLNGKKAPTLDGMQFAVFGLGDSSYEFFNQAGRDLDERLRALGASGVAERIDADVDFEQPAQAWNTEILRLAEKALPADEARIIPLQCNAVAPVARHDRNHPFTAEVLDNRRISTPDALSSVHHLALEIDPAAIRYQPGDTLGVLFRNDLALVEDLLALTGLSGDAAVDLQGQSTSLSEALLGRLELTQLHPTVVTAWAEVSGNADLRSLQDQRERLRRFAGEHQLVDLLKAYPAEIDPARLVELLRPLQPRLYSIASSQATFDDEVHLTVATLQFQAHGRDHLGGASGHLTRRLAEGDSQSVYVAENPGFRLPPDGDTPIIMVGAGTGIAPFRAFLQEREVQGSSGRNWLVFGNRHFHRDFLYQTDWLAHRKAGRLQRISLAFSRDSADRPYVQDRLREEGAQVWRWLDEGARLYVCGGLAMEKSVREALQQIALAHGGLGHDAAAEFVEDLQAQGRYLKDVY